MFSTTQFSYLKTYVYTVQYIDNEIHSQHKICEVFVPVPCTYQDAREKKTVPRFNDPLKIIIIHFKSAWIMKQYGWTFDFRYQSLQPYATNVHKRILVTTPSSLWLHTIAGTVYINKTQPEYWLYFTNCKNNLINRLPKTC